nr:hypothetical protein CFP56_12363 [Quercus suber]
MDVECASEENPDTTLAQRYDAVSGLLQPARSQESTSTSKSLTSRVRTCSARREQMINFTVASTDWLFQASRQQTPQ